jgi:hypothetical protein
VLLRGRRPLLAAGNGAGTGLRGCPDDLSDLVAYPYWTENNSLTVEQMKATLPNQVGENYTPRLK